MSLNYDLRRERHAIGEFSASLHFFGPVNVSTFLSVVEVLKPLAQRMDLPASVPIQMFQFSLQGEQGVPASAGSLPTGVGFQRYTKEGEVAEAIVCDADSIVYRLREYTVWEEVLPRLTDAFAELAPKYMAEVPAITSFRLQYLNEFVGNSTDVWSSAELFRKANKWLSPLIYDTQEPCHSHTGVYIPVDRNQRRLVNVNCDNAPATATDGSGDRHYVKLLILAGCFYNVPGGKPLVVSIGEVGDAIRSNFDDAHRLEKQVLREVVADSYLEVMGALDVD